jgi:hypothetical protein
MESAEDESAATLATGARKKVVGWKAAAEVAHARVARANFIVDILDWTKGELGNWLVSSQMLGIVRSVEGILNGLDPVFVARTLITHSNGWKLLHTE